MKKTIPDCADRIKSAVSMRDVAEMYGLKQDPRSSKIKCPFHNDTKPSMHAYPGSRGYYCFVCGTGGDVINFVQRYFGLNFLNACRKLNDDFQLHLNIDGEMDPVSRKEAERIYRERMERKKQEEAKRKLAQTIYDAAFNRFTFLDLLKEENKPTDPAAPISPDYAYACKYIDSAWQAVQEADQALRELDNRN